MKKIIPAFFISIVLLILGIVLSLIWGVKGGAFMPSSLQPAGDTSFWKDFGYFCDDIRRHLQKGMGKILIQLLLIFPTAFVIGQVAKRFGQPSVIGHILAGVCLGPSLFGWIFPDTAQFFFAEDPGMVLHMLGALGVMLFMFLAGMEMDFRLLKNQTNAVIMVSHIGIFLPFFLGVQVASWIYRDYGADTHFLAFALMMGIGMSITAFPVLVRILQESGLMKTPMGQLALSAAAVDDVTAWLLLSVIIAVISASSILVVAWTLIALAVFLVFMIAVVRPLFRYWHERFRPSQNTASAVLLFLLFFSATATEVIGIHTIFGAFIAGTLVPKDSELSKHLIEKLEYFCTMFLLPIFFVISGLRTHLNLLRFEDLPVTALLLGVAIVGKWGGAWAAGRIAGLTTPQSVLIGALMNTRGLMELIVLNIAYELGIFSSQVFSMMVVMALVTTAMTGPLINFYKKRNPELFEVQN